MKIGIIGLKPRQVADLEGRKFKHHEVSYYDSGRAYSSASFVTFARDKDLVFIMQQMVPKHLLEGVPAMKRRPIAGSVSTIMRLINELPKPDVKPENIEDIPRAPAAGLGSSTQRKEWKSSRVELPDASGVVGELDSLSSAIAAGTAAMANTQPEPTPATEAKPVEEAESPQLKALRERLEQAAAENAAARLVPAAVVYDSQPEEKPLASDVPTGHRSQYLLPKTNILINYPNSGGVMDYSILKAAQPGDVIRFARPEGLPLPKWRNRVYAVRYHYLRNAGLLIEAHFYNEYVDFKVMDQKAELVTNTVNLTVERKPVEYSHPSRPLGGAEFMVAGGEQADEGIPVVQEVPVLVEPEGAKLEQAGEVANGHLQRIAQMSNSNSEDELPAVAPEIRIATDEERGFWRRAFLIGMNRGTTAAAAAEADEALAEYRSRF